MEITIFVAPVPKARARVKFLKNPIKTGKMKGSHVMSFTPKKTVDAEEAIREFIRDLNLKEYWGAGTPIHCEATFFRLRPASRKNEQLPTQKPDWDNYGKLLTDALNELMYDDDSQITTCIIRKRYAGYLTEPRIYLKLRKDSVDEDF
jgi:Holliday junction resolvase RusA-like endonuclease